MSKKETIEDRFKALKAKEDQVKLQLTSNSDEMRDNAKRIGKIALTAGLIAILGYWIFNVFFGEDEKEGKKNKKKKKSKGTWERIGALAMPYISKFLDGVIDLDEESTQNDKKTKESIEESEN